MGETYNKDWHKELKSFDVGGDDKNNKKQDKIRAEAIKIINDYKVRNLPPEQFNRLVDGIEDILFRKNIDEAKLKADFKSILEHEGKIVEYEQKLIPLKSALDDINKVIKTKGLTDDFLDKMTGGEVDQSLKESFKRIRYSISKNYTEIKDIIFSEDSGLTEKQKKVYDDLLAEYSKLLHTKSDDPSFLEMLKNQTKNTGKQISVAKKTIESKLNSDVELFKKASTFNFEAIINIYSNKKQDEFEKYLISNPKERKKLLKGVKDKNGLCPDVGSDKFINLVGKLQQIEFSERRKSFETNLINRLGKEYGKQLLNKIDNELRDNSCTFDLVAIISDFNKTLDGKKTKKLSSDEIKFLTKESLGLKNDNLFFKLLTFLSERDIDLNEIEGKNEKEIRRILGLKKVNKEDQDMIIDLYFKYKDINIAEKRFSFLSTSDIKTIIDGKEKGKSNNDINNALQKTNPNLRNFNNNSFSQTINISSGSYNSYNIISGVLKDISETGKPMTINYSSGFNPIISKNSDGYSVQYGDKKEFCKNQKEVLSTLGMGEYMSSIGLGFLFGGINRMINKINSKPTGIKINEKDGLDYQEKVLGLKTVGEALIPGFDSTKSEIRDLQEQFNPELFNIKIQEAKKDKNNKFYNQLKNINGNISSLGQLARVLYPANSNKDFSIDLFINNL